MLRELEERLADRSPKRILALDGGGVRGAVTIGFLERMEQILAERKGGTGSFRLCDYFDLIGGTSTGAIIATLLAMGRSAAEARDLYINMAQDVFRRSPWRIFGLHPKFGSKPLMRRIQAEVGDRSLDSPDVRTGLAIVMKRLDTGSPWVVTNNPQGAFFDDPEDGSYVGNRHFPLASLVRASAAAPHYFAPEWLEIIRGEPPGLFVDGGVSPHNSPSLMMLMLAGMQGYGFEWPLGADNLLLVSVGTGTFRARVSPKAARRMSTIEFATRSLGSLVGDAQSQALTLLQWLSHSKTPWMINSEVGDLADEMAVEQALLSFLRYDVRLERDWLADMLDEQIDETTLARYRAMDDPSNVEDLLRLGQLAAERQVRADDFPPAFD